MMFILHQKSTKCADIFQFIHLSMTKIVQALIRIKSAVIKMSADCAFLIKMMCDWHSVDQSSVVLDQKTFASNDSMSATTENAAQKPDNPDIKLSINKITTAALPSPAQHPNLNNTVQVEELKWEIRKITGKRHTSLG